MTALLTRFNSLRADRRGVTALEYGLIAAAVVAIGLAGFSVIGEDLANKVTAVQNTMDSADAAAPAGG